MGPAGAQIPQKEIDLGFLQEGATRREEVAHQLAVIDTSYSNPRLFWGRWSESRWGYWWVVAWPCNGCAAGDAHRKWHVKNLLVSFDENGVVSSKQTINDDSVLWQALHSRMLEAPPPPNYLTQPIHISLMSGDPTGILLSKDRMEFERRSDSGKPNVQVAIQSVVRFSHRPAVDKRNSSGVTCHALEFSEKTVFGKKIKFCAEAAQIGNLFQYLQQSAPPGMNWQ